MLEFITKGDGVTIRKPIPKLKFPAYAFSKGYIKRCPNDGTFLPNGNIEMMSSAGSANKYSEYTRCSHCNCEIIRKPTQKRIDEFYRRMRETVICAVA